MADRVYPSAKPAATHGGATAAKPPFPATKAQLYGASRPAYRPRPPRRHRRGCCCCLCLWLTLAVLFLLLAAATAGAAVYLLYRPHRPSFSVDSIRVSYLNLTSSTSSPQVNSRLNFTITARNPNKKLVYAYDPISVEIFTGGVAVGDGSFPAFVHRARNTTTLRSTISGAGKAVEASSAAKLRSDLKSKAGAPLKVELETKVKVKMGAITSPKVGIRVSCDGIRVTAPSGKTASSATTTNAKCKVDLRIKIWKWTF